MTVDLATLRPGDVVEARELNGQLIYRGKIDDINLRQGVLWILQGELAELKLLNAFEHKLWPCPV